ncbi:putative leucine-rich repeat-containing protein DDB_G0290503 [Ptychodera flava]|uniref:putative leucine-rich repeat-containing protein DDB_G0290503 n=1 Tax=Ptychodera flava TaxID=63121 RepID=UPI00396A2941
MQLYIFLVICCKYLVTGSSLPDTYYDNQQESESFSIQPPDDYQREEFLLHQMTAPQPLDNSAQDSLFDVSNDVEDGSAIDFGNLEVKIGTLDRRLKDLNVEVLQNTLKLLRMQQKGEKEGPWKQKLDYHSETITNISHSVERLEGLIHSQGDTEVLKRLKEQAGILENLTETLKKAVSVSQQNEEEIASVKHAQSQRFGAAVGRLNEQANLMKDIQKDIAVIQLSGETGRQQSRSGRRQFQESRFDLSQSILDMQRKIGQVEKLVTVVEEEISDIEDELKDDIDENKEKVYEQGIDMVHLTYDLHRVEEDLMDYAENHDDEIDDIRHSIQRLTAENKDQWVDIDTLDDTVDNMRTYCCEDNAKTFNGKIASVKSDLNQFRTRMEECLTDITAQLNDIKIKFEDFKSDQNGLKSKIGHLEDQMKLEEMKREQSERYYSSVFQKANSGLTSLQEKHSFEVAGIKNSINSLIDRQQENGEKFSALRTRIEYLERDDLALEDEIHEIQDAILKLTSSIRESADSNRLFLQQLIHDLLDDRQ